MALDPRFICSSDLEGYFVDKDTGLPLAAGIINFFSDVDRTVPKDVYQLSGAPPYNTASFVNLGSSITLNSVGSYQDGLGNSIVIYYFPFEGSPTDSPFTNIQELYYVTVESSGNVQQFTREAWPPLAVNLASEIDTLTTDLTNMIPNGQFLVYNTPMPTTSTPPNTETVIAQSNWLFRQSTGSTGVYSISVETVPAGSAALTDFPPNAVRISRGALGNESIYELFILWQDVNIFAKTADTSALFNLLFAAKSNDLLSETVNIFLVQNFGGGASDQYIAMPNVNIDADGNFDYYNTTISMPDNSGITVNAGSYVGIAIRMPSTPFDLSFTDFALTLTNTSLSTFPTISTDQVLSRTLNGTIAIPDPAGMDLYLPQILTPQGMEWDTGQIGEIVSHLQTTTPSGNYLLMDGAVYSVSAYSAIGIPYRRLYNFLYNITPITATTPLSSRIPIFGTGTNFVTLFSVAGQPTKFGLSINSGAGVAVIPTVGTTGWSAITNADPLFTFTVSAVPTASKYFTFTAPVAGPTSYYVWYQIGSSADPAPGGTGIKVSITGLETAAEIVTLTQQAVNGRQFATFNLNGYFLRGYDPNGNVDPNAATRTLPGIGFTGAYMGSIQGDLFKSHTHPPATITSFFGQTGGLSLPAAGANAGVSGATGATGGAETRPVNFYVNWYIRY